MTPSLSHEPAIYCSLPELIGMLETIFVRNGTSDSVARVLAANCASAERDGSRSHGLFRMAGYVSNLKSGFVDGRAVPQIQDAGAAFLRADAGNGYARPALEAAMPQAIDKTRSAGACVLAIGNAHHNGPLWLDVEPFAEARLIALSVVNSVTYVVPHGGHKRLYGTNPMAFAVPRADGQVLLFDQATAAMAHGEVKAAARENKVLPEGIGLDASGLPTSSPQAILDGGALLPFGGHKGSSIAMMIDILGGALTGSNFSHQVNSSAYPGADSAHTGQTIILIDPTKGNGSLGMFTGRIEELVEAIAEAGQTRLPGERRLAARKLAAERGIAIEAETWKQLRAL
ncbi:MULTISPECIES: Ldh family oxidoreductase [unclassified Mesorhizobium]|uniref:Ldh family oxidoreductase n=1 Tax=unclassified Mesorhizobium TaxID=325217 RepID=UPI001093E71C|nr:MULTISPECIES: Ldh family oxidoreductase [unclassified Mesorhizobium]TGT87421.1 Ldh family oxidoreductase [Mesorhizobium sp. M8A.F.Ca.ET.161.01.1.1]TGV41296.1 Ldh family oxidoreductase [Mesorhizobium sp. M8A.F.Ca.ET.142.01.1.1]